LVELFFGELAACQQKKSLQFALSIKIKWQWKKKAKGERGRANLLSIST
jgi:hypothetical protein